MSCEHFGSIPKMRQTPSRVFAITLSFLCACRLPLSAIDFGLFELTSTPNGISALLKADQCYRGEDYFITLNGMRWSGGGMKDFPPGFDRLHPPAPCSLPVGFNLDRETLVTRLNAEQPALRFEVRETEKDNPRLTVEISAPLADYTARITSPSNARIQPGTKLTVEYTPADLSVSVSYTRPDVEGGFSGGSFSGGLVELAYPAVTASGPAHAWLFFDRDLVVSRCEGPSHCIASEVGFNVQVDFTVVE